MKKKINIQFVSITALAIIATVFLCVFAFYEMFQQQVLSDLRVYGDLIKELNITNEETFETHIDLLQQDNLRITVIDEEGDVLYDSVADPSVMVNHSKRPEIEAAFEKGSGSDIRTSETLEMSTYYYALKLDTGYVIRVAREADSIWSIFISALPVIIIITIFILLLCIVLSRVLTKSLLRPIEQIADNLGNAMEIQAYPELTPFITTIHDQHQAILKNAKMRQEFTANVTHELKTPLTSISGYAELIETGMATDEDVKRFAKGIHKNASRLLMLINDILRLSELDDTDMDVEFTNLDLYAIAESCVDMLQINAEKYDVSMELQGNPCYLNANRKMMDELIYNLCDNAIRYNNPGGSVLVSVLNLDSKIVLSVKDNGIGISKQHQDRIFERFYRVDKSRSKSTGGTGLGLAIVKHIVVQHNAKLELFSEEGTGTEVRVIFGRKEMEN